MNNELENEMPIHEGRGRLYKFFSNVFNAYPDDEFYKQIKDMLPVLEIFAESTEDSTIVNNFENVKDYIQNRDSTNDIKVYDDEQLLKYTNMFCLPETIMFEESYYSSDDRMVMQKPFEEMNVLLNKYNYKLPAHLKVYEDSLIAQLYFMSVLAFETVEAIKNDKSEAYDLMIGEQKYFHTVRFGNWVDTVCNKISTFPIDEILYKSMAVLLLAYIRQDKEFIESI